MYYATYKYIHTWYYISLLLLNVYKIYGERVDRVILVCGNFDDEVGHKHLEDARQMIYRNS